MVSTKITRQRMENQIVGMRITRPRVGQYKNNSLKGWIVGEIYGRHENNSPKTGELNGWHGNNAPQLMDDTKITRQKDRRIGQLNGRHENHSPKKWTTQN